MTSRAETLRKSYNLKPHEEGGSFAEVYTSAAEKGGIFASMVFIVHDHLIHYDLTHGC